MKIIKNDNSRVEFKSLKNGDIFSCEGATYMKIELILCQDKNSTCHKNALSMQYGKLDVFDDCDLVEPKPNAVLMYEGE